MNWSNRNVLVVGMARSGIAAAKALAEMSANVTINDTKTADDLEGLEVLDALHIHRALGVPAIGLLKDKQDLILSPGIPMEAAFVKEAVNMGIRVIGELELGYSLCPCPSVAITGTNGKTTVTTWVGEMLSEAGFQTTAAGNIGTPATEVALKLTPGDRLVLEVSSYQLESIAAFHPRVAVLLNLTEDHLARHKTMENYLQVKSRVYMNMVGKDIVILNADDSMISGLFQQPRCRVWLFSRKRTVDFGVCMEGDSIVFRENGRTLCTLADRNDMLLPGEHNLENAMAAAAASIAMGADFEAVRRSLHTFKGVEHRIETVCTVRGVTFINDSKATNVDSTLVAIACMKQPYVLLLGGSSKVTDYHPLIRAFDERMQCAVICGQTAEEIVQACKDEGFTRWVRADNFEEAVRLTFAIAKEEQTVLLSPACASFDFFKDFEHRGRVFKEIVKAIQQENA